MNTEATIAITIVILLIIFLAWFIYKASKMVVHNQIEPSDNPAPETNLSQLFDDATHQESFEDNEKK